MYANFYTYSDFFVGSQYRRPKQQGEKPFTSFNLTYEQMAHEDLPEFNLTLTKEQLNRIVDKNKTMYLHMQVTHPVHQNDPDT